MTGLIQSGQLIDIILVLIVLEFLLLLAVSRRQQSHFGLRDFAFTLVSGACLLAALRLAIAGADPAWILLCLTAALAAHLFDLRRLLKR